MLNIVLTDTAKQTFGGWGGWGGGGGLERWLNWNQFELVNLLTVGNNLLRIIGKVGNRAKRQWLKLDWPCDTKPSHCLVCSHNGLTFRLITLGFTSAFKRLSIFCHHKMGQRWLGLLLICVTIGRHRALAQLEGKTFSTLLFYELVRLDCVPTACSVYKNVYVAALVEAPY